jgi:ribosome-binding factor A
MPLFNKGFFSTFPEFPRFHLTLWSNNQIMEENKRQKQVGKLIMEELSDIFQREGMNIVEGGMVSILKVMVTPDLLEARVYLSFFQVKDPQTLLHKIKDRNWEWRKLLGQRVKNQLRRIPELTFYIDDTVDHIFKMDQIFKKISEERKSHESAETNP